MSMPADLRARLQEATAGQMLRRLVEAARAVLGSAPVPQPVAPVEDDETMRRHDAAQKVRQAIDASRRRVMR
jgi:hypothetical protein